MMRGKWAHVKDNRDILRYWPWRYSVVKACADSPKISLTAWIIALSLGPLGNGIGADLSGLIAPTQPRGRSCEIGILPCRAGFGMWHSKCPYSPDPDLGASELIPGCDERGHDILCEPAILKPGIMRARQFII
jgi:hypothetical protein